MRHSRRMLRPGGFAPRLEAISLDDLERAGVRAIIVDLDNTLVAYHHSDITQAVVSWIEDAKARGFRVALVSNNFSKRVEAIGAKLSVPSVASAMKPLPRGFLRALRLLDAKARETVFIGDQLLTDVVGAHLVGLRTILVDPITERGFFTTRVMRVIERRLLKTARQHTIDERNAG